MKKYFALIFPALCLLGVLATLIPSINKSEFSVDDFGRLPVLLNGRIKPFDSVARNSLLVMQGRQRITTPEGVQLSPTAWLLDVMTRPEKADTYQVFEIVNPELLALFNLRPDQGAGNKRFSLNQLRARLEELTKQVRMAAETPGPQRDVFQRAALKLHSNLDLYHQLRFSLVPPQTEDFLAELKDFQAKLPAALEALKARQDGKAHDEKVGKSLLEAANKFSFMAKNGNLHPIPPAAGAAPEAWRSLGDVLEESFQSGQVSPHAFAYAGLAWAWSEQKPTEFNEVLRLYRAELAKDYSAFLFKCRVEAFFNSAEPFYSSQYLYVLGFLLGVFSWAFAPESLTKAAFRTIAIAFVLTTVGIFTRMWLESRPPVTNLYSSALFVGWVAVAMCLVLEKLFQNGVAIVAASFAGFCTLIIAHHLSVGGDTMEMMRAVLDSNFWLATHVVTIAIGYGATFLAGFLALIYVLRGVFTRSLDEKTAESLDKMVYGTVCFATFFSLIGTLLGGIWADQSWGRFWGWDPKENGALLIVLWNAIYLHARWAGLARRRGCMSLAIFGNVITAWSWFGTNMLGVGLHSYGFTDAAFWGLISFALSQVLCICIAILPTERWSSRLKA